ncbi:MAG: S-layer homology domain-containing protein, partial [Candidatus Flemingiibacterium sp.]
MRNLKKFLALVLATLMVVSAAATVSVFDDVAEDNQYAAAIEKLVEYGITNGVDESNFAPDNDVERYQMALFMARALKPSETDWSNGMEIFDDVEEYYGAIAYAYTKGIVTGIGNNLFAPHAGIRYQDALIMALRALGYDVDVSGDPYWLAAYELASDPEIGLTKNVAVTKGEKTLTRAETAQVIYNMLKAKPADGGATIEQKNFGVKGIDNSTTFVITATANQSFTGASEKVSDADYVTLQALNKDGTFGDGFYARFDTLGFDEDVKADDVIGYSVDLVNYDAKTNKYEKSVPNKAEVYLTTDDNVTVSDDKKKITVDKKVYWLVDEYTNNTIKNEIIVKTDDGKVTTAILDNVSKLYYNKNGDVVAPDGTVLALMQEVKAANGQTLYKLAKDADKDAFLLYTASELLNVKEVADKYNDFTSVDGYADVDKLTGAVQITLFDDDNDETYDRAITSPIYMSVYNNKDGKKVNIDSNATGLTKSTEGVTYTETLTKGEIFYYTYNKQTKVINVLGTVDIDYGTIDKINLTDKAENFTITISGTPYKFAGTNSASFGASLATTNKDDLNKADCIDNIVKKPALDFVKWNNFVTAASIGSTVAYYAYNGYIIYAESYDVEESFNLIAIKNMLDIDSDGLIADIYVDGKLVEDATISEVINTNTNKTVKFADLSSLMFSSVASKYFNTENNIYKGIKLADGSYRLGIDLVANNEISDAATTSIKNKGFGLTKINFTANNTVVANGKIEFLDGISVNGDKYSRIRTNDDTVFYFINNAGKLQIVKGSAKDSIINVTKDTEIYVDKLGYAADEKVGNIAGTATRVIVYHYGSVEGFGIASTVYAIAYIPAKFDVAKFQIDTAKGFGLGSNYEGTYYYYSGAAVNMSDGSKVSLYASSPLTAGKAYQIDENGVVITDMRGAITEIDITKSDLFASATVAKSNIITDDRYVYIKGGPV